VWETHWDPTTYTVPAEKVTDTALSLSSRPENTRLVAHYMQPHLPYVGKKRLDIWESEMNPKDRVDEDKSTPTDVFIDAIESENLTEKKLREAYKSNLKYVMSEVSRLVQNLDCPIVVTSDHGENLGENGRYFHEHNTIHTRLVPWLVVSSNIHEIGNENSVRDNQENLSEDIDEDVVQNRLEHLGYVE
jgi:membrane-anchored protein YejM (alkaline phosphatase superfamily)